MKIKCMFILLMLSLASIGKSQIVLINGDTVMGAIVPTNNIQIVHYCSNIKIKTIPSGDTLGIAYNGAAATSTYDTIAWNTYVPVGNSIDTVMMNICYNWSHSSGGWSGTTYTGNSAIYFYKDVPTSKICWVTADSNFAHNVIIWDTAGFKAEGVDSVRIFYYVTSTNRKLLATTSRNSTYYVDSVNNPNNNSFKYLLAGVNSCGNEDTNSAWHTTAWVQQSSSAFTVIAPYTVKGTPAPVSYYILYRDTLGNGRNWDSIYESPGTILNDPNYGKYPNAKYYVAAVLNIAGCSTPGIVGNLKSSNINKSRSNMLNNIISGMPSGYNESNFSVYPNPNQGVFCIALNGASMKGIVKVYSTIGQEIFSAQIKGGNNNINITGQPSGIYLYRIISGDGQNLGSGKFVIQ